MRNISSSFSCSHFHARARARIHTLSHTHIHAHSFFPSSSLFLFFFFLCFFSFFFLPLSSSSFISYPPYESARPRRALSLLYLRLTRARTRTHTALVERTTTDRPNSVAHISQRDAATTTFPQSHGMQHRNLARYRILIYLTWPRARTHAHARIHTYTRGRENRDVKAHHELSGCSTTTRGDLSMILTDADRASGTERAGCSPA